MTKYRHKNDEEDAVPVPPDEMIYGDGEFGPDGPRIVCCGCGNGPVYRMAPPLCIECDPALELEAAKLWRKDHPNESVFNCDLATKGRYRRYVLVFNCDLATKGRYRRYVLGYISADEVNAALSFPPTT